MLKSRLIPMRNQDKQLAAANLTIGYSYNNDGAHSDGAGGDAEAAYVKFYGINKTGPVFIAEGYLETTADYVAGTYAACVLTGIPVTDDYPYMTYEIVPVGKFARVEGNPQLGIDVGESSDNLSANIKQVISTTETP